MYFSHSYRFWIVFSVLCFLPLRAQDIEHVQIQAQQVNGYVYMLTGAGGNIGVCIGDDGIFLIDDQFAPLTEKIKTAVAKLSNKPIRFVVNTHWHPDHTGGNENLGKMGAILVAQQNVYARLSTEQFLKLFNSVIPPAPKEALPVITFMTEILFHLNEEEIYIEHLENAHTDGDAVIHFRKNKVIHMGDLYFNGMYPFIDLSSGGSIDGVIRAGERIVATLDSETKIIPGHGPISEKAQLEEYVKMLKTIRERIFQQIQEKKTLAEILGSKPTQDLDEIWGKGFMKPEKFIEIVYNDLHEKK